jgi:hypothetical protein
MGDILHLGATLDASMTSLRVVLTCSVRVPTAH